MAVWIGHMGGFLMFALIVTLFLFFLYDVRIVKDKQGLLNFGKIAVFVAAIGMIQLFIGGLMYNYCKQAASILDLSVIWNTESIGKIINCCKAEHFEYSIFGGIFPLYPFVVHVAGGLLMGQYDAVMLYLNFLGAILLGLAMKLLYSTWSVSPYKEEGIRKISILFLFPGAFLLFLPTTYSWLLCFGMFSMYFMAKNKKILAAVFVLLAMATNGYGILFLILYIMELFNKKHQKYNTILGGIAGIAVCLLFGKAMGWKITYQELPLAYPVLSCILCTQKWKRVQIEDRTIMAVSGIINALIMYVMIYQIVI